MIKNLKEGIFESCQVLVGQLQDICTLNKIMIFGGQASVLFASLHLWENTTIGRFWMYANQKSFQFWFIKFIYRFIWMY